MQQKQIAGRCPYILHQAQRVEEWPRCHNGPFVSSPSRQGPVKDYIGAIDGGGKSWHAAMYGWHAGPGAAAASQEARQAKGRRAVALARERNEAGIAVVLVKLKRGGVNPICQFGLHSRSQAHKNNKI